MIGDSNISMQEIEKQFGFGDISGVEQDTLIEQCNSKLAERKKLLE